MDTRESSIVRRWTDWLRGNLLWLIIAVLVVLLVGDLIRVWGMTNWHDMDVFLLAAQRLIAGEDIYADTGPFKAAIEAGTFSMEDDSVVWPYAYAPLMAILFLPAAYLPYPLVRVLWWGINTGGLLLGSWLSLRAMGGVTPGRVALTLLLVYKFEPAVITLRLGQIEMVQFLLLAFVLYALSRGWERRAGLALGLAAGLKFFPGALVLLLLWRRRWRAAAWATGTALVSIVGSFWAVGFDAIATYLDYSSIYGIAGAFAAFPLNQSFNGLFSRNLVRNVFSPTLKGWHLPWLAKGLILTCDLGVVASSAWLTWQRKAWRDQEDGQCFALEFSLAIMALLLVSPHSQAYTFVWALLSLIVLTMWLASQPGVIWWQWGGLLVSYLLLGRHYELYRPGLTRFVQSHYLFGALLLWAMLGVSLLRNRRGDIGFGARPHRLA